jgi:hypothetical protein
MGYDVTFNLDCVIYYYEIMSNVNMIMFILNMSLKDPR